MIVNAVSNLTGSGFREETNFLQHQKEILLRSLTSVMGMGIFLTGLTEVRRLPFHLTGTQRREGTVFLFEACLHTWRVCHPAVTTTAFLFFTNIRTQILKPFIVD